MYNEVNNSFCYTKYWGNIIFVSSIVTGVRITNIMRQRMYHVVREASVTILVTFVGRSISVGKYVVQYKLWDCRMQHVVLEAKKWSVSIRL